MTEHTKSYMQGYKDGENHLNYQVQEAVYDSKFTITLDNGAKLEVIRADTILKILERNKIK